MRAAFFQWTMDNGQLTMDNGQLTMDNGQLTIKISTAPIPSPGGKVSPKVTDEECGRKPKFFVFV